MLRDTLGVLVAGGSGDRPFGAVSGVRPGTSEDTVTLSGLTWTCAAFGGVFDVQVAAEAGPYLVAVIEAESGDLDAQSASNPRKDYLSVQVDDPAESDGTSVPTGRLIYTAGTPGSVPAPPDVPDRAVPVALFDVPKSGTGDPTVTWIAPVMAAAGGTIVVPTVAALDDLPGYVGMRADVLTTPGATWRCDGTDWVMHGVAEFADATARDAALTDPVAGMKAVLASGVTYRHNGSTWEAWESDWISFTPTLSNINVGTGGSASNACRYRYVGGQVEAEYKLVLGTSGASVGSTPTATLPVAAEALTHSLMVLDGLGSMFDSSGSDLRVAFMQLTSTTVARFAYITPSGIGFTIPTNSLPWNWAAGDAIHMVIRYTPA
jgi:hypothetical protein